MNKPTKYRLGRPEMNRDDPSRLIDVPVFFVLDGKEIESGLTLCRDHSGHFTSWGDLEIWADASLVDNFDREVLCNELLYEASKDCDIAIAEAHRCEHEWCDCGLHEGHGGSHVTATHRCRWCLAVQIEHDDCQRAGYTRWRIIKDFEGAEIKVSVYDEDGEETGKPEWLSAVFCFDGLYRPKN